MRGRWRGWRLGLAIVGLLTGTALALGGERAADRLGAGWDLVVRDAQGAVVLRAPLPDGRFALRYRNSVYRSLAEERFTVSPSGRLRLVELAADEAAVLAEYYGIERRPSPASAGDSRAWWAPPAVPVAIAELSLAATRHGQRTLLVVGSAPVPLWSLTAGSDPGLTIVAEQRG